MQKRDNVTANQCLSTKSFRLCLLNKYCTSPWNLILELVFLRLLQWMLMHISATEAQK